MRLSKTFWKFRLVYNSDPKVKRKEMGISEGETNAWILEGKLKETEP